MATIERLRWRLRTLRFALTVKPVIGGSPDDPPEDPPAEDPPKEDPPAADPPKEDPPKEDPPKEDPDEPIKPEDDWKAKARKHETALKRERRQREEAERKLKEREDADKSEQDKAIEAAREEGRTSALTEAQKERRADRLEVAVTRLAARGIRIGEGDEERTARFADPEDALVQIEREMSKGDLDDEEIFNDQGAVQNDALVSALVDLLDRKPHLEARSAGNGGEPPKPKGRSDAGKGDGGGKDLEEMSVEDHVKRLQKPVR